MARFGGSTHQPNQGELPSETRVHFGSTTSLRLISYSAPAQGLLSLFRWRMGYIAFLQSPPMNLMRTVFPQKRHSVVGTLWPFAFTCSS